MCQPKIGLRTLVRDLLGCPPELAKLSLVAAAALEGVVEARVEVLLGLALRALRSWALPLRSQAVCPVLHPAHLLQHELEGLPCVLGVVAPRNLVALSRMNGTTVTAFTFSLGR